MMRAVAALLVLVNAALAAMQGGWLPQPWQRGPAAAVQQINPDRIRLLPATSAATGSNGNGNSSTLPRASAALATTCLEIGPFKPNAATQAKNLIMALLPAGQGDIQTVNSETRWWVHLPDAATRSQLDQQIAQLRGAGISEYYILNTDGKPGFTLSLGLFNDRDRAQRFADALRQRSLDPRLDERPGAANKVSYRVTNINGDLTRQLQVLARQQWPTLGAQPCPG